MGGTAHAALDSDGDSFNDSVELFIGTDPNMACGVNAWPVDNNDGRKVGLADVLAYVPVFNTTGPGLPYTARFDLNADNKLGMFDILMYVPFFNATCTPPSFAGLKSATTCIPGPGGRGRTASYNLSWDPATDDVSPSKKIVYDVYEANTSGGEDFSKPTYTTSAGATSFTTPPLTTDKYFYFVVRARDEAGQQRLQYGGARRPEPVRLKTLEVEVAEVQG